MSFATKKHTSAAGYVSGSGLAVSCRFLGNMHYVVYFGGSCLALGSRGFSLIINHSQKPLFSKEKLLYSRIELESLGKKYCVRKTF